MSTPSQGVKPFRSWIDREAGRRIAKNKALGMQGLAVYWALACYRPDVRPSIGTLAKDLGISRAAAKRWVRALEDEKAIKATRRPGGCTTYALIDGTGEVGSEMTQPPIAVGSEMSRGMGQNRPGGWVRNEPGDGSDLTPEEDKEEDKGRKTKKKTGGVTAADVSFPSELDTAEARESLREWIDYKRAKGQPYKRASHLEKKLAEFAPLGSVAFVAAVNHSIGSNYAGIFPAGGKGNAQGRLAKRFDDESYRG